MSVSTLENIRKIVEKLSIDDQKALAFDIITKNSSDLKSSIKIKKSPKLDDDGNQIVKQPNSWIKFTIFLREKVIAFTGKNKDIGNMPSFGSYLKKRNLGSEDKITDSVLIEHYPAFIIESNALKAEKKSAKSDSDSASTTSSVPEPVVKVLKPKTIKKHTEVIQPPVDVTLKQKINGIDYLTCSSDGSDIWVSSLDDKYIGLYNKDTKFIDTSIPNPFE